MRLRFKLTKKVHLIPSWDENSRTENGCRLSVKKPPQTNAKGSRIDFRVIPNRGGSLSPFPILWVAYRLLLVERQKTGLGHFRKIEVFISNYRHFPDGGALHGVGFSSVSK